MAHFKVFPWEFNTGLQSVWLGGSPRDADQQISGGFAFMDMSRFLDDPKDGFQDRGWLMSGVQSPTSVRGRCAKFQYVMRGLNTEALRVIRVDIDTSDLENSEADKADSGQSGGETQGNLRAVLGREMEATIGDGASLVKVDITIFLQQ